MLADGILGVGVALTIAPAYSAMMEVARYVCACAFTSLSVRLFCYVYMYMCMHGAGYFLIMMSRSQSSELSTNSITMFVSGIIPAAASLG